MRGTSIRFFGIASLALAVLSLSLTSFATAGTIPDLNRAEFSSEYGGDMQFDLQAPSIAPAALDQAFACLQRFAPLKTTNKAQDAVFGVCVPISNRAGKGREHASVSSGGSFEPTLGFRKPIPVSSQSNSKFTVPVDPRLFIYLRTWQPGLMTHG